MAALRLSLCMIVRDEAAMLPDLLASVAGLWDELVVADTGSTDGTVALLAAAGARIVHHPWDDDFAAARNASLDAARGRWILCLDADERVSPALREQIRALLDDPRAGAATVVMRNALPGGHHRESSLLRLFRNDPAIRFRHRIHEDVLDDVERHLERTGLVLRHLTGFVEHLGYVREVAADRAKKARDEALLRRTLAEDPDDLYCWFKLLELARFWEDEALGDEAAAGAAQRLAGALPPALRRTLARNPWSGELAVLIARRRGAEPATALAWLDGVAERICPGPAWHLEHGRLHEALGETDAATAAYAACLAAHGPGATHHHVRAQLGLCRLAVAAGDAEAARRRAEAALALAPADAEALLVLVSLTAARGDSAEAAAWARAHVAHHPTATEAVAGALLECGLAEAAAAVLGDGPTGAPALGLGLLTCALALGRDLELDLDLDPEAADAAFRAWISRLWRSRRTDLMAAFAANAGAVTGAFPWLEEFLAAETARLRGG